MYKTVEYEAVEDFKILQYKLLKNSMKYLNKYSPYYKSLFNNLNLTSESIRSLKDIQKIPILNKASLLKHNAKIMCCDLNRASDIVTTSGSTGTEPIVHPLLYSDIQRLGYNEQTSFAIAGIKASDMVMINAAMGSGFVAGLAYYLGVKRIGASVVRTGAKNMMLQVEVLEKFPISIIIGVPSNLIKLHEYIADRKDGVENLTKITKMVLIGEAIRNEDFSLNHLGKRLNDCYPAASLYSTYANTETCTSFCECSAGNGGHFNPELAYIEILDKNNCELPEGIAGRLVITTFGSQGMPLLRYDTGDITFCIKEKCKCGRITPRIGPILGRDQNILKIGGVSFSQIQIENIILSEPLVNDYCLVIQKNEKEIQSLLVYFSSYTNNICAIKQALKQNIWEMLRVTADIRYCSFDELDKIQTSTASRKNIRFISELS